MSAPGRWRWLAPGGWYAVIWWFSAQNGQESQDMSDGVLGLFGYDIFNSPMALSDLLSFLLRKAAHMFIFFVLTGLLVWALWELIQKPLPRGLAALALCAALAALDELHQTFVPGRSGLPRDVVIDTLGGACFLLLWYILRRVRPGR